MNRVVATGYFLKGDLQGFFNAKPTGEVPSKIFVECINYAYGKDLDDMIGKCLSMFRNASYGYMENDVDYRARATMCASYLDSHTFLNDKYSPNHLLEDLNQVYNYNYTYGCDHKWVTYHGLFETDEYCKKCNERKK